MKKCFLNLLLYILLFASCNSITKDEFAVSLSKEDEDCLPFGKYYAIFPFIFLHNNYNIYYKQQLLNYKNIPNIDSSYLVTYNTDFSKFLYDLNEQNLIDLERYSSLSKRIKLDTLIESKKPTQSKLVAATGYSNGRQYIIVDFNNNKDFGDEQLLFFDRQTDYNIECEELLEETPSFNFKYSFYNENKTENFSRKVKVFPKSDYYVFQHEKDSLAKKLGIVGKFQDYWKGSISIKNLDYDIAVQGFDSRYLEILIKNSKKEFHFDDMVYNSNFSFKIKDTIKFANDYYLLDSINTSISKLFLKKLKNQKFTGHRIGELIKDYQLVNIEGKEFSLFKKNSKKYTLLYNWGTWCAPCKKITPELKRINEYYENNLKIVGVALDKSIENVEDYTSKNQMNWEQVFVDRNLKKTIIKDLKVFQFPTLILINSKHEIVYRGGSSSLNEIEKIIQNIK
jgi:thiol-disulfide isomerase/thioredoxin